MPAFIEMIHDETGGRSMMTRNSISLWESKGWRRVEDSDTAEPTPNPAGPERPPEGGKGSGVDAWRAYVAELTGQDPAELPDDRDELIALADKAED